MVNMASDTSEDEIVDNRGVSMMKEYLDFSEILEVTEAGETLNDTHDKDMCELPS